MNSKKTIRIAGIVFAILTITVSCSKTKGILFRAKKGVSDFINKGDISDATGVKINKKGTFSYPKRYKGQKTPPGTIFIEGASFVMGAVQDDILHDWNNEPRQMHVQSFYMDETEVTNLMYNEYLYWIKKVYPPTEQQFKEVYTGALPDTLSWRNSLGYNEVMVNNYLRHPAFAKYPVVGVSWIQASEFCKWRTNRVNEVILEKKGYLKDQNHKEFITGLSEDGSGGGAVGFDNDAYREKPSQVFGGKGAELQGYRALGDTPEVYAKVTDGVFLPAYRLPTEVEWEYAAGAIGVREYNNTHERKKYPWAEKYTRNAYFKNIGQQLANFKQGRGDYGGIAGWSDDSGDITVEVKTYPPNQFGLYDMAGNVSEWVSDVYRSLIDNQTSDFNYFRGNIYEEKVRDENGEIVLLEDDEVVYDTLPTGKIIATALPGQVKRRPLQAIDTLIRTNFNRSYNMDYNDGDDLTNRNYRNKKQNATEEEKIQGRMYNSPIVKTYIDEETGEMKIVPDKDGNRTTLISNKTRVYKGGSWKDRAYWLDPSQRRFKAEYLASDDLGFRCAVSRLGDKSLGGKRRPKSRY